jgi:hypothetical protein
MSDTRLAYTHEVRLYVGSREGYGGPEFGRERVVEAVRDFHRIHPHHVACLRVTPCCYVVRDYLEEGWELACINYPRFPKPFGMIDEMMRALGRHLLVSLKQNRVTVVGDYTTLIESPHAEDHPK